ncbi:putative outer dense fiber protein 3-like isoform 2 [Scophthalmus maximus]|uniref:Putative outer dense fiber protein 3-like n=1 Tax=Scophthalmus maximus TaxID=52904 RepID=A0A2U9BY14_SCOMX|nr:outer dense fiber protein 3-B [Scophthalmus maximus]XP_035499216.1 outer dense fiber protein 3-B [Scophthalmus maximus]XP_035499217.1 outer dense fiber protein 3-B [Scophthalmus maximus]XP_035499218.1 outer dense fiber protein 3-B [Scophthalmus maximus]XP_035499219.1 outer dense fiber protein 3-B [Scophthalmus maximus]XP_035499220.1 outer dense fiber protein 3-B [Scophthalmus maximus]XP_035499221.1 outer dense fiber protein 3-B [Scophthalmus maximus]AWP08590.1 putative outer dense fiber p
MASVEPWVGTWRPHRPRGPIAALYGSPGPKYALPGLTGVPKHDPTKYRAPMFSFGTRHDQAMSTCSPGPRYLIPANITRAGKDGTPAFSLHSRTKEQELFKGPGPGHYSPEHSGKLTFRSAPAYSLFGRSKDFSLKKTPGPASYSLPPILGSRSSFASTAPAYSLSGRSKTGSFHEDLRKTPGPAAYKLVDPSIYGKKTPQYSMTGRNFVPGETTQKPGPGSHYPEQVITTRAKAPSFTFGIRHSEYIAPLIVDAPE